MKLWIDNHEPTGRADYTKFIDAVSPPKITRSLNQPSILRATLVGEIRPLIPPSAGAKVFVEREDGSRWFTGTIEYAPQQEFVGRGVQASVVRIAFEAKSDEVLLDRTLFKKGMCIAQSDAADIIRRWSESAGEGVFDLTGVQDVGDVKAFTFVDGEKWSEAAGRLANSCRASYAAEDGAISLRPIGLHTHELNEADENFIPEALKIEPARSEISDWTVVGEVGPGMYVKDYFVGDGHTLRFPMSMQPFLRPGVVLLEEEYDDDLSPAAWEVVNPQAIHPAGGKLVIAGGTGRDGETTLSTVERLELGGCAVLEHGALVLNAESDGLIGGLYSGAISKPNCIAGFGLQSEGGATNLQAVITGSAIGDPMPLIYGHRYELTTRFYSSEVFRIAQAYRWSGGEETSPSNLAGIRFVMEVRDLDSGTPIAAATVLYEGLVASAPALATYAVVNAANIFGTIAYTRLRRTPTAEVRTRSAADGTTKTRIVGLISDGAECIVTTGPAVYFYAPFKPANGDQIVVTYRASERKAARVFSGDSDVNAAAEMVSVESPMARSDEDCRHAATALLNDSTAPRYKGSYTTWSDFLPAPIVPGDMIHVCANSRGVEFTGVVRAVVNEIVDGRNDRAKCVVTFAEDGAELIGIQASGFAGTLSRPALSAEPGHENLVPALDRAEAVSITSLSVQIDAGMDLCNGGGIEVRREGDFGWGEGNDRNLIGLFSTRVFTVPRSTRGEDYYLRMYDAGTPRNYSPTTMLVHVDVKDDAI